MLLSAFITLSAALSLLAAANPLPADAAAQACSQAKRIAGAKQFVKTIASHSAADAAKIPLAEDCTRVIYLTPNELSGRTFPVNVGVNAETVRDELVALATVIEAGIVPGAKYTVNNNNGSVTVDVIQTDFPFLPYVHLRQIHNYDLSSCLMTSIVGYAHGQALPAGLP